MKTILKAVLLLLYASVYNGAICQQYDPDKAIEYAEKWWNGFNTEKYYNYEKPENGGGDDCAAFVSQCLIAGGLDLSKGTDGSGAYVKPDKVIADGVASEAKRMILTK